MIFNKHNPYNWLKKLNATIMSSQCRLGKSSVDLEDGCFAAGKIINNTVEKDASIWWVGNGGSAAICSHLSQDMLNKLGAKSFFLGDTPLITCMANDFGYENVYLQPLERLARPHDLLIAISSSGNSENILLCAEMALTRDMELITLSGFKDDNRLWNMESDLSFFVPANLFGIVELSHEAILHGIIESLWLEKKESLIASGTLKEKCVN
ncbi:SIS domain-containing protein [Desulfobacula phenolica]|uniref:D-sedoheptulose 7-phosphate isomerase n=1 Tax=Desulfobacula phenolica TaxID=90732 RepID=A0A1H2DRX4_9BACT|nr:SIS domain-containing protein [Desulfobacula phenolica]SDT85637.1 D-sedoheptulose 7-phosphate isomerase [Desulfobacula phenolica]